MAPPTPLAAFDLSGLDARHRAAPCSSGDKDADARSADAGKRSFVRLIGHELRTPLNSIIGFSEIIGRELYGPLSEPRYREHADIIRDSGLRMLKLVDQVMEIVRLESGVAEFDIQPISALQAVEAAVATVNTDALARAVAVVVGAQTPLDPVLADERALQTMVGNLLQNAVAHAPPGGRVELSVRSADARSVSIEVRDQGCGVDPAQLARLLRPFEQAEDTLTRHGRGAGLGLTIVRLLCDATGARLHLASAPGQGFTAGVVLPTG